MAKRERFTTPKGIAAWPWLRKADDRPIKGKPRKPAFKCNLRLNGADAEALKAFLDPQVEASYAQAIKDNPKKKKQIVKAYPYTAETDETGDVETGFTIFKFKQNATIKMKNGETVKVTIPLFDAKGKPLPANVVPYSGSVVKVSYSLRPYFMESTDKAGISLDLSAVQVLELVSSSGGTADQYGFGSEDGYEADDAEAADTDNKSGDEPAGETEQTGGEDQSDF